MRLIRKYLLFGIGGLFIVVAGLVGVSYFFPPTYEADARLPGTNCIVAVQLQPMHFYLPEYSRALVLRSPGAAAVRRDMFPDTGGYMRTQLYRLHDGRFIVEGSFDAFAVDPAAHRISKIDAKLVDTAQYLGAFDDTGDGHWRFIPAFESPEQPLQNGKRIRRLIAGLGTTLFPPTPCACAHATQPGRRAFIKG